MQNKAKNSPKKELRKINKEKINKPEKKKQNIDEIIFGPKKMSKTIDQGKNAAYSKKRVHLLGKNYDDKNNRNIIKEKRTNEKNRNS